MRVGICGALERYGSMSGSQYADVEHYMVQLFNRYMELSKKSYEYCEGIPLYPNEIHTVEYIAVSSTTNLTEIANQMGLTRGAVTKMISKLENLGLLVRYKYHPKQKEIYVHLTKAGVRAYEGHKEYHAMMWERLSGYFQSLEESQRQVVLDFLEQYLEGMNSLKG